MTWVARDRALLLRGLYGFYRASEWSQFLDDVGVDCETAELPATVPALIVDGVVVLRERLRATEAADSAWHEIGHWALHEGDRRFWLSRPQGRVTVAKFERQANDFAGLFPVWGEE